MFGARGIIIHKEDFREADRLYTLYTKEFGKLKVHAKGVRKIDAKLKGHLELLNVVAVRFVQGRHYPILVSVECRVRFPALRGNPPFLAAAYAMSRILNAYVKEGSSSGNIWNLTIGFLRELEKLSLDSASTGTHIHKRLHTFFILKFIRYLGFTPELNKCAVCGKTGIGRDEKIYFHPHTFGVLCRSCGAKLPHREELQSGLLRALPLFFEKNWGTVKSLDLSEKDEEILATFAHTLLKLVL